MKEVFPALDYTLDSKALTLRSGIAPTIMTEQKTAAQKRLAELRPFDEVSEKAQERFKRQFPRFDVQAAIADFYAWREDKNQQSGNTDAHFWRSLKHGHSATVDPFRTVIRWEEDGDKVGSRTVIRWEKDGDKVGKSLNAPYISP